MAGNYQSCDPILLKKAASCLAAPPQSKQQRRAIDLLVRTYNLKTDGTDYTGAGGMTKLIKDAHGWLQLTEDDLCAISLYLDWQNAITETPTTPTTVNALVQASQCFLALPELTQKQLMAYLKCQLNSIDEPE